MVSFTPWQSYSRGKSPWYSLNRRLSGLRTRSGHCGEDKQFLSRIEPRFLGVPACNLVNVPTTLFRLLYLKGVRGISFGLLANLLGVASDILQVIVAKFLERTFKIGHTYCIVNFLPSQLMIIIMSHWPLWMRHRAGTFNNV